MARQQALEEQKQRKKSEKKQAQQKPNIIRENE